MNIKYSYNQQGFTLIEVTFIAAIIGILSSIALFNLTSRNNYEKLKSTTRSLENWIGDQREIAIKNGYSCDILINQSKKKFTSQKAFTSSPTSCSPRSQTPSTFDFNNYFRDDLNNLKITMTPLLFQTNANSGVRFSHRGFSENFISDEETNLKPEDQTLLIRLSISGESRQRCIKIVSPIGLIRDGYALNAISNCNFDGVF